MYNLDENNQVVIDDKVLYQYNEELELVDFKITDALKIYCDDTLASCDVTLLDNLTAYNIKDTITINKNFDNLSTLEVFFAIEISEEKMIFNDIDYSKYFAYQYFKLTGIETVVE